MRILRFAVAAALAACGTAASAKWYEASSRHFVIYSEEKPESLRQFADDLERYDQAMRFLRNLGDPELGPANRLTVYVVRNLGSVRKLAQQGRGVAGFYIPRAGRSLAVIPQRGLGGGRYDLDAQTVLFHEYAHHFLYSNYPVAWPTWLSEGYAEFHSTAKIEKDGSVGLGLPASHRAYGLVGISALPIPRMMEMTVNVRDGIETEALYARSWLLTHYLTFEPARKGQLQTYVTALADGKPSARAASDAFGDLRELGRDLDGYLQRRTMSYLKIPAASIKVEPITLRALTPGEEAVMMLRIRSKRGVDRKEAKELVPQMRKAAAPFPGDAVAQVTLAEAEYDAGNLKEAEEAADRAMAADPRLIDAYLYKGRVLMARALKAEDKDEETWRAIRKWFVSANRIDGNDPEPLVLYYSSFAAAGQTPTANAVVGLNHAYALAPQDRGLRLLAARQFLADGKADEARGALALIAYDPHAGGLASAATLVLETLAAKGTAEALKIFDEDDEEAEAEEG